MRDLPNIARLAIVALLFIALLFILRQFGSDVKGPEGAGAEGKKEEAARTSSPEAIFYPAVPGTLPDLNDGYLFNQDRLLDESDIEDNLLGGLGADTIDMEALVYSGSIIIGDMRKALVAYQEQVPAQPSGTRRNIRSRTQRKPAKGSFKHKQLQAGEVFMGYKVALIEEDRIVFEKGSEKIEKFLFDASKERVEIKSSSTAPRSESAAQQKAAQTTPPQGAGTVPQPPNVDRLPKVRSGSPVTTSPASSGEKPAIQPSRRTRRSQRLLGIDPSFVPPTAPVGAK